MSTRNRFYILLLCIIASVSSCKSLKNNASSIEELFIFQNGKEKIINSESITIDKKEFSLRLFNEKSNLSSDKFNVTRVASSLNSEEFDTIKIEMQIEDSQYFSFGSAFAVDLELGHSLLFVEDIGSNSLFYDNEKAKSLNLLEKGDPYYKLEFKIAGFFLDQKAVSIADTHIDQFYLAILNDRNDNGIINKGELTKLTINLK